LKPHLKKPTTKKGWWRAQGVGPEFNSSTAKKKKERKEN
jgi:hypothetical protein